MQKVASQQSGETQGPGATTSRIVPFPASGDRTSRTSVFAVLFLDIVEYSKKPVSEQLQVKERFNVHIAAAISDVPADERIVLDTGDGVAVSFLGDPEDALFVAINLTEALHRDAAAPAIDVRAGINLGPVRLMRDINSQPNIIGDGINVAQRVMSFARPGQVLVSRAYYEVITRISGDYTHLFAYQGSRTDKHVREHEIYELADAGEEPRDVVRRRNRVRRPGEQTSGTTTRVQPGLLANRRFAFAFTGLSVFALAAAALYYAWSSRPQGPSTPVATVAVAPLAQPPAPEISLEPPTAMPQPVTEPVVESATPRIEATTASPPQHGDDSPVGVAPATPRAEPARVAAAPKPEVEPTPRAAAPSAPSLPTPAKTAPAQPPGALVLLAISPWGEVFVDGKSAGVSPPLSELDLAPGKYRIEIHNSVFKPYQEYVRLEANQTIRIKHKFTEQR